MIRIFLTSIFLFLLTSVTQATDNKNEHNQTNKDYLCQCSVTDNYGGHYFSCNHNNLNEAINQAFRSCFINSQEPGTCAIAEYDPCACN